MGSTSRWTAELRAHYAANPELATAAVPMAERPGRLAAIRQRVFSLEIVEETLLVEAEQRGMAVDRRADADPRAIFDESVLALEADP